MKNKVKWIIFLICLGIFLGISILLFDDKLTLFDNNIYNFIISFKSKGLTSYFKFITRFANTLFIIAVCLISLLPVFIKKYQSLYLVGLVIISTALNQILKHLIIRERPVDINLITEKGYSFPSGHSMASVTLYGFIIFLIFKSKLNKKNKWISISLLTLLIISICISRIYLGVHHASDVIAGIMLSICLLILLIIYMKNKSGDKL